jgi:hypothetical protein
MLDICSSSLGIPMKSATRYDPKGPSVMIQAGHLFRGNPATYYDEGGHPFPSEPSGDAGRFLRYIVSPF